MSCGLMDQADLQASPALSRLNDWQDKMSLFWGRHPWAHNALRSGLMWLALGILSAFFEDTRAYTAIFVLLAVLVFVNKEFVPLAPIPFNLYNAVTSRNDAYSTAARGVLVTIVVIALCGLFVGLSEQLGNVALHAWTNFLDTAPTYWATQPLPWLTVVLLAAPLVYFSSLVVSSSFVTPYLADAQATSWPAHNRNHPRTNPWRGP